MRRSAILASFGAVACLLGAGCGSEETGTGTGTGTGGGGGAGPVLPPAICLSPGPGPYPLTFTDVTADLGLGPDGLNMTANNLTVGDIDGDHWPDLAMTKGSSAAPPTLRDNSQTPLGLYRVLRNVHGTSFEDVTWTSGLLKARDGTQGRAMSFVIWGDIDNDGDMDAFVAVFQDHDNQANLLDASSLYLNNGDGTFTIGPDQRFTPATLDPVAGAAFLDYNHDGLLDLFVGHHYGSYGAIGTAIQDSLFAGDGLGNFIDVTVPAGLKTLPFTQADLALGNFHKPTWGVTACDIDGDGWDDILTSSYGRTFNAFYRNKGDGTFEDLTMTSGFAADDNLDYSDNFMYQCYCQAHPAEPTCAGAPAPSGSCTGYTNNWTPGSDDQPWRLGGNGSNAACGDLDNDGDVDVLAVELAHDWAGQSADRTELLYNDGFPAQPLSRPGNDATGLVRQHVSDEGDLGAALADLDNDGRLDVIVASSDYPGTHSLVWQQGADGKFVEVDASPGARIDRAHGLAVVDFDRDGDYDLVLGTSLMRWSSTDHPPVTADAYAHVLRNDSGQNANKLILHLVGAGTPGGANKDAVGARITATAGGMTYVREVQGGYGLTGLQQDHLMIIGLGASCTADQVTIRWPNAAGDEVSYAGVLANYVLVVEEGKELVYQTLEEFAPRAP